MITKERIRSLRRKRGSEQIEKTKLSEGKIDTIKSHLKKIADETQRVQNQEDILGALGIATDVIRYRGHINLNTSGIKKEPSSLVSLYRSYVRANLRSLGDLVANNKITPTQYKSLLKIIKGVK